MLAGIAVFGTPSGLATFARGRSPTYLVFYPGGAARHICLALSASHPLLDFGEAVGFHSFLAISFYVIAISRF